MKTSILKKTGLLLVVFSLLIGSSFAQQQDKSRKGPPPVPDSKQIEKMVTDLSKELNLDDEQEKLIGDLYVSHFDEVSEITESSKNSAPPSREKMGTLKADFENEVKSLLHKDQQKLYEAYLKEKESQRKNQQRPKR